VTRTSRGITCTREFLGGFSRWSSVDSVGRLTPPGLIRSWAGRYSKRARTSSSAAWSCCGRKTLVKVWSTQRYGPEQQQQQSCGGLEPLLARIPWVWVLFDSENSQPFTDRLNSPSCSQMPWRHIHVSSVSTRGCKRRGSLRRTFVHCGAPCAQVRKTDCRSASDHCKSRQLKRSSPSSIRAMSVERTQLHQVPQSPTATRQSAR
jgi:hypothetical protein